jgi:xylan 1,4-beta-xylosidase
VESSGDPGVETIMRDGVRGSPDVSAIASLAPKKLAIMAWHYHDDDLPGPAAAVQLKVSGLPAGVDRARLTHYRIDDTHSNAYAEWKRMGSPIAPTRPQYERLEATGQLQQLDAPSVARVVDRAATIDFTLPRQGVSLIVLEWDQ